MVETSEPTVQTVGEFHARIAQLTIEQFLAAYPHPFLIEEGAVRSSNGKNRASTRPPETARARRPLTPAQCWLVQLRNVEASDRYGYIALGRGHENDIVLPDPTVSKFHCYFMPPDPDGGEPHTRIVDVSTFGTLLDGERLENEQPQPLPNDGTPGAEPVLAIGDVRLLYFHDPQVVYVALGQRA